MALDRQSYLLKAVKEKLQSLRKIANHKGVSVNSAINTAIDRYIAVEEPKVSKENKQTQETKPNE